MKIKTTIILKKVVTIDIDTGSIEEALKEALLVDNGYPELNEVHRVSHLADEDSGIVVTDEYGFGGHC